MLRIKINDRTNSYIKKILNGDSKEITYSDKIILANSLILIVKKQVKNSKKKSKQKFKIPNEYRLVV